MFKQILTKEKKAEGNGLQRELQRLITGLYSRNTEAAKAKAESLRKDNPGTKLPDLCKKAYKAYRNKTMGSGFAAGVGGLVWARRAR